MPSNDQIEVDVLALVDQEVKDARAAFNVAQDRLATAIGAQKLLKNLAIPHNGATLPAEKVVASRRRPRDLAEAQCP